MSEKTKTTLGLILAVIAIIVSFTVPEIRECLGLRDDEPVVEVPENPVTSTESEKKDEDSPDLEEGKIPAKTDEKNDNPGTNKKVKPDNPITQKPPSRPLSTIRIYDAETGTRDVKFENYLKGICQSLEYEGVVINGSKSVEITPNKSVPDQVRASIELNITVNNNALMLPMIYGRGDGKKEAVNHALLMNKDLIKNKIQSLK